MAGGGKETPRQKMIGMMYLVLTALLAMNVSKDILMTFVIVNESMERSNTNFTNNNVKVMKGFEEAKNSNPMAKPYYEKALIADKLTEDLFQYIEKLKHELIAHTSKLPAGGDTLKLRNLESKDDVNINTHELIGDDERNPASGEFTAVDLKNKITEVHDKLLKMVQDMQKVKTTQLLKDDYEALIKKIESLKPTTNGETEDGNPITWEILNFYHNPIAGVITNLSKIQSDVKNVESELVSQFAGASGKVSVKFSQLAARVVAPSSYIQAGQPYQADIFIAASSSDFKAENMSIILGVDSAAAAKGSVGTNTVNIVGGIGKYEVSSGVGDQSYDGVIKFKKPTGEYDYYPFHGEYTVAPPSVAVSADKMNVFYIGVPNPITVSAAGISPGNLIVSGSGGGISIKPSGGPGKYIVTASSETPKGQEAKISVSARTKDGVKPQGPPQLFRVKRIPDPVTMVGGKKGTAEIKKMEVGGIGGVLAKLEGFDFEANFVVISYEFTAVVKGNPIVATGNGNQLTQDMKTALGKVSTGSKVFIDAVKAKGPDGSVRSIPGVTLKVKG
jgi:gliding motility-associated protein GldM